MIREKEGSCRRKVGVVIQGNMKDPGGKGSVLDRGGRCTHLHMVQN